jgi:hypothetical protein
MLVFSRSTVMCWSGSCCESSLLVVSSSEHTTYSQSSPFSFWVWMFATFTFSCSICGVSAAVTLLAMFWTMTSDSIVSRMNATDRIAFVLVVGIFAHLVICRRISANWRRVVSVSLSVMKLASQRNLYDDEESVTSVDNATRSSLDMWALRADRRGMTVWVDESESGSSLSSVPGMSFFPLGILSGIVVCVVRGILFPLLALGVFCLLFSSGSSWGCHVVKGKEADARGMSLPLLVSILVV